MMISQEEALFKGTVEFEAVVESIKQSAEEGKAIHAVEEDPKWVFLGGVCVLLAVSPLLVHGQANDQRAQRNASSITFADGRLAYEPNNHGDRIPDYSFCGYAGADTAIPDVPIRVSLQPMDGAATRRIQAAIDYVGTLPLDESGLRGAVFLSAGVFGVKGSLHIRHAGVVLRGAGAGRDGTVLRATGLDRRTLIRIHGTGLPKPEDSGWNISDDYVPVGATTFHLATTAGLKVGDAVIVSRPSSSHVDVIDIRYWTYTSDGEPYAPLGGQSLSPRQHLRRLKPSASSFSSIVRAVRECRMQNPQKAVTYHADLYCRSGDDGWAVLMGGGSLPNLAQLPKALRNAVVGLVPSEQLKLADDQRCLAAGDHEFLIYSAGRDEPTIVQLHERTYTYSSVDPKTGEVGEAKQVVGNRVEIPAKLSIIWIR